MRDDFDKEDVLSNLAYEGRAWEVEFEDLSPAEQTFRCIWELEGEVSNGGFAQYYFNSSGDYANRIVEDLRQIGAIETSDLVTQAHRLWPHSTISPTMENRRHTLGDDGFITDRRWDSLDAQFFEYRDNLSEKLYDYLAAHRDEVQGFDLAHETTKADRAIAICKSKTSWWKKLIGK